MKKKLISICFALLILYCLIFPRQMASSVASGLALWYRSILPTLLPFCVFSGIIIHSGIYDRFFESIFPLIRPLYPVRPPLIYPLAAGFLFGFPLGSKICADLYHAGKISNREAELVCCISNNFGPAFLYNYLIVGIFEKKIPPILLFTACYLPPLLIGRIAIIVSKNKSAAVRRRKQESGHTMIRAFSHSSIQTKTASRSQLNMKIIDAGIIDGFTTMIKLAGYILLASLLADILNQIPWNNRLFSCICIGALEITNGLHHLVSVQAELPFQAALAVGMVNFGGVSGLLQTNAMMKSTGIRMSYYICFKLLCSVTGILLLSVILQF